MSADKYFLAIVPPEPLQSQLMSLKEHVREHYGSKGALRSPAHITLHMPFEWKTEKEDRLIESLENFTFAPSFMIRLHNFSSFEPRVIFVDVIKNETLCDLQKELVKHVKKDLHIFNEANNMRGFHPHITIAFRDLKKDRFYDAITYFKTQSFEADLEIKTFHLLKHSPGKWEIYREFSFEKP